MSRTSSPLIAPTRPVDLLTVALAGLGLAATGCGPVAEGLPQVEDVEHLAATLMVPGDHATITDAIAAAGPDDVIEVGAGTFTENLLVPGGVQIVGQGIGVTTIAGQVEVIAGQAGLAYLDVTGPSAAALSTCGIVAQDGNSVLIDGVAVSGWGAAVCLHPGDSNPWGWPTIVGSTLSGNGYGVILHGGEATITNTFVAMNVASGVWVGEGGQVELVNNTLLANATTPSSAVRDAAVSLGPGGSSLLRNNTITGSVHGLWCDGCAVEQDHNNLWDNDDDYLGEAAADPTTLSVDPAFVDVAGGNLRLSADSPLVDAGSSVDAPALDWWESPRPSGAGIDIGAHEVPAEVPALRISEVMANPLDESSGEFVEIVNLGPEAVELAGLVLHDGDSGDALVAFDGGDTTLEPGAYAVVVDPDWTGELAVATAAILVTVGDSALGNRLSTSDPVHLLDGDALVDTWTAPFNPGNGISAERVDADFAGPPTWEASSCETGSSPGSSLCPLAEAPITLYVTEVMANPLNERTGEYVEVYNHGALPVNLADLWITDGDTWDVVEPLDEGSTLVFPGEYALIVDRGSEDEYEVFGDVTVVTVDDAAIGNGLAAASDPVTLVESDGETVVDSYGAPFNPGNGVSVERLDPAGGDVPENWVANACGHTAGTGPCVD